MRNIIAWKIASFVLWLVATPKYYKYICTLSKINSKEFEKQFYTFYLKKG